VFRIRGEYKRLTGCNYDADGNYADPSALAVATIGLLAVAMPDGFTLEPDPLLDDAWEERTFRVFTELRAKELSFRPQLGEASQAASA
jgi:hypothetical protein